jgi:hypothetical protein
VSCGVRRRQERGRGSISRQREGWEERANIARGAGVCVRVQVQVQSKVL